MGNQQDSTGQVFVLDLNALKEAPPSASEPGSLSAPGNATRIVGFTDNNTGKGPQYITPATIKTTTNGIPTEVRFLLSNTLDYNRGTDTVILPLNPDGSFSGEAKATSILKGMSDKLSNFLGNKYQMNIQRSQGAVYYYDKLTKTECALVADYHMIFNNPGYADGSMFGKQEGGKVGIIKNPFDEKPEYLGSTTPIINASIKDLRISSDGKSLWGNINYWAEIGDTNPPSSDILSWNLDKLIKAANKHSLTLQDSPRPIPFDRTRTDTTNLQIPEATPKKLDYGWVFGMVNNVAD